MNYTEATAAVAAGKSVRRPAWPASVHVKKSTSGSTVIVGQGGSPAEKLYSPSTDDQTAKDWTSN